MMEFYVKFAKESKTLVIDVVMYKYVQHFHSEQQANKPG